MKNAPTLLTIDRSTLTGILVNYPRAHPPYLCRRMSWKNSGVH